MRATWRSQESVHSNSSMGHPSQTERGRETRDRHFFMREERGEEGRGDRDRGRIGDSQGEGTDKEDRVMGGVTSVYACEL